MSTTKTTFKITARWSDRIIFEGEYTSRRECILDALAKKKDLSGSDLSDSNLRGSNLSGSNLRGSDLSGSNLRGSNLRGSDLRGSDLSDSNLSDSNLSGSDLSDSNLSDSNLRDSNLSGSDLSDSNLRGSDLSGSDLSDSNLRGSNLSGSDLSGSNLSGSDLSGSNLRSFKTDLIAEILKLPDELENLRGTLIAGKIDGTTYEGECACLAGTIANNRGCTISSGKTIQENGVAFVADSSSPREIWFWNIKKGDTPQNNQCAKIGLEWIDEAISIRDHIRATAQKAA